MAETPIRISQEDPDSADARACLRAYFDLLTDRIPGISTAHVPDPDPEADAFRPPAGVFLVARSGVTVLGCVSLRAHAPGLGEVKRLWVDAAARGHGLGRLLMREIENHARKMGLSRLWLDSNSALIEAVALYRSDGWTDIPAYTGPPADVWMKKEL